MQSALQVPRQLLLNRNKRKNKIEKKTQLFGLAKPKKRVIIRLRSWLRHDGGLKYKKQKIT
jgi:hypothetical protein